MPRYLKPRFLPYKDAELPVSEEKKYEVAALVLIPVRGVL